MTIKHCSPNKKINKKDYTCFELDDLIEIAKAYNKTINNKNFKLIKDIHNKSKKELWTSIYKRLEYICNQESCWSEQDFIDLIKNKSIQTRIREFTFKPPPIGKRTWFSTDDINKILYQYQELYKTQFVFIGAVPCDISNISTFNWEKLQNGTRYLGIVFNTHTHNKPGEHWVSSFIDNKHKTIDFFDSLGKPPNKHMKLFFKHFKHYTININNTIHQRGLSNCGVYSCFFIIQRLKKYSFDEINSRIISDKEMTGYRDILFRN